MKLRNKKTGDIWEFDEGFSMKASQETAERAGAYSGVLTCYANSLAELNEEWEDYTQKEPLIKDDKIRNLIRDWAKINNTNEVLYETLDEKSALRFIDAQHNRWIEVTYCNNHLIYNQIYTIAELCGEEE